MLKAFFLMLGLTLFCLYSCNTKNSSDPNSTGQGSEILVVCEKADWDALAGKTVRDALTQELEGLPESETEYTLINVPYAKFSSFLRTHRNVLILDIKKENTKSGIETTKDTWSHPQRVIKIIAPDDSSFVAVFNKYKKSIKDLFVQNERARFAGQNALSRNLKVESMMEKDFGIRMILSSDFYQAKKTKDFLWLRKETTEMSLGLMIYYFPYTDTNQLSNSAILLKRNEITRQFIPGPADGSYMEVADEVIKPVADRIRFKGSYAVETRGLWQTHGDFMGGPFINYSVVDTSQNRIVVFDGYVYYPNKSKRNFIRQLESIIWGAEFVGKQSVAVKK